MVIFIGNIITFNKPGGGKDLIDGQQRLITIYLLLSSFYSILKDEEIKKYLVGEDGPKIILKDRISDQGYNIFSYFFQDEIPIAIQEYNEYRQFRYIKKYLINCEGLKRKELLDKLIHCSIIEICFLDFENQAHKMFVNLNTKGVPLQAMGIIKSALFEFLVSGSDADFYKNQWFNIYQELDEKSVDDYLSLYLALYFGNKTKHNKKTLREQLLDKISDLTTAKDVFEVLCDKNSNNCLLILYSSVKKVNSNDYSKYFSEPSGISFSRLFDFLYFFKYLKYSQFDIALISILKASNPNDRYVIKQNFSSIQNFTELILLFQMYSSARNTSPSSFANNFY